MSEVSMEYVVEVSVRRGRRMILNSIIKRECMALFSDTGDGKSTMTDLLAETVTAEEMQDHPARCTSVTPYNFISPMYDGISVRGPIIAGESYTDPLTGQVRVRSDLADPIWYTDVKQILEADPLTHVLFKFEEINCGMEDLQAVMLLFIDQKGLGPHRFTDEQRERVSFMFLGNPPEALPSADNMSKPLAARALKWIKLKPDSKDVIDFIGERGELAPEVEKILTDYPDLVSVAGVSDDGQVPGLDPMQDLEATTPIVNGLNPRKWHSVSREMQAMRDPNNSYYNKAGLDFKLTDLKAMVHPAVATLLANEMEVVDNFTSMAQVVADPKQADIPNGLLMQSMQIRMLIPLISDETVEPFIIYADRFTEAARSGVMAYLKRISEQDPNKRGTSALGRGRRMISDTVKVKLQQRYLPDLVRQTALNSGMLNVKVDMSQQLDPEPTPVVPQPAPQQPGPANQVAPTPIPPAPVVPQPAPAPIAAPTPPPMPAAPVAPVAPAVPVVHQVPQPTPPAAEPAPTAPYTVSAAPVPADDEDDDTERLF